MTTIRLLPLFLALALTLAPSLALADDGSGVPSYVVEFAVSILVPIGSALGAWLAAEAIRWLRANVRHTQSRDALERAVHAVDTAVAETSQTFVESIKLSAADGKLTAYEANKARALALEATKSYLGPRGIATLRAVIGTDDQALDRYLVGLIEARVRGALASAVVLTEADLPPVSGGAQ